MTEHFDMALSVSDGSLGWDATVPYNAILVTAVGPPIPRSLLNQLADGGRKTLPVGEIGAQVLELWQRKGDSYSNEMLLPVAFVPLRGREGI